MLALKIIGITLLSLALLILLILMLNIKLLFAFTTDGKAVMKVKLSIFTLFDLNKKKKKGAEEIKEDKDSSDSSGEEKPKKQSRIAAYFIKKLGLQPLNGAEGLKSEAEKGGISDTASRILTVFMLFAGQIFGLLRKMRVKRFKIIAVCAGEDAADTAMEYGTLCSAVYPLLGYIDTNVKSMKGADIRIGCDFENEAYFEADIYIKLRVIHVIGALLKGLTALAESAAEASTEETK